MDQDEPPASGGITAPLPEMDLVSCIAYAQANFGSLAKDGHAVIRSDKANYEYDYHTDGLLMARAREILSPLGVAIFTSAIEKEVTPNGVWVTVEIDFHKTTNGQSESIAIICRGLGQDARDKAYNKGLTSAVRTGLTKMFLQGGDVDPEQTVNEPARDRGPAKLAESRLRELTRKAVDCKVTTTDGALDPKLLVRIAQYVSGKQIARIDEIPVAVVAKLVDGANGKPPALDGYAADPQLGLQRITEKEIENGW